MTNLMRVVEKDGLRELLDSHRSNGIVLCALNLFMLGYLRHCPNLFAEAFFWCDGVLGVIFARIKGIRLAKNRGAVLTGSLLQYWSGNPVTVLGSMSHDGRLVLEGAGLQVEDHHSLPSFDVANKDLLIPTIRSKVVLITLPSPKQELLALDLAKVYTNTHFYCIGGALNMLANPKMDCPVWIQRLGLEFVFRLKSDTWRRLKRLFGSASNALLSIGYLTRCRLVVVGRS